MTNNVAIVCIMMCVLYGMHTCLGYDLTNETVRNPISSDNNTSQDKTRNFNDKKETPNDLTVDETALKQADSTKCILRLSKKSISHFRHFVFYKDLSFVYLKLNGKENVSIKGSRLIVGENVWIWTFFGRDGALEFLNWPFEFGIWSMGLLTSFTYGPIDMDLRRVSGDCSNITVGEKRNDKIISDALVDLTLEMMRFDKEKYGPTFWCYKKRMFIESHFFYMLCKHMVCPIEALKYSCCSYFFDQKLLNRTVDCKEEIFKYDKIWWSLPTVVAVILFTYFPLILMKLGMTVSPERANKILTHNNASDGENIQYHGSNIDTYVYLDGKPTVTLLKTLLFPCTRLPSMSDVNTSRLIRFVLPFLSLVVICIQILLDYSYLHEVVLTSIGKGVPLGFRSMIAGYEESSHNFLPFLGGPFVAISIYLVITCLFSVMPKSLSQLLLGGFYNAESMSRTSNTPFFIDLRLIERYGSVSVLRYKGYQKLYQIYLGQCFMIINYKFWSHVLGIQITRWNQIESCFIRGILCPLYLCWCVIELFLCLSLYGLPIVSFGMTIIRTYYGTMKRSHMHNMFWKINICLCTLFVIAGVVFFLFMFCTIFLDAMLFVSRILIFTFTGVIIYPKVSYGYLIFTLTVVYYLWECLQMFSLKYQGLLKDTIKVCQSIQRANDVDRLVIKRGDFKGVKEALFEHVIESHCPRRKQAFLSIFKLTIIIGVLGLSLDLLIKTDKFRELHVIMHVGTALFICAFPKILKSMCYGNRNKYENMQTIREINASVKNYLGYFADGSDTDSE